MSKAHHSQLSQDRMLGQLSQCEYTFSKCRLLSTMCDAELENYKNLSTQIASDIEKAKEEIETTKTKFKEAKTIRKNRVEYEVLAKIINEQPDRKQTCEVLSQIQKELRNLEETKAQLDKKWDLRRKQFHVLVSSIHQLQGLLDETESDDGSITSMDWV
ncbi:THO complex subunit 7 homolog isoform X4 [Nilaparvata lugens]|uniref:THO complex subunit 7 homolog isoform X4 n=1 Tax=Nilaparvata lugens TaxID=108931 RepID=UPI00193D73D4|nr:THO complex subunit 7 homolog isoform X4 [Nilaparvata lugens]